MCIARNGANGLSWACGITSLHAQAVRDFEGDSMRCNMLTFFTLTCARNVNDVQRPELRRRRAGGYTFDAVV